jgi:ribosome biogenesis GTPase A
LFILNCTHLDAIPVFSYEYVFHAASLALLKVKQHAYNLASLSSIKEEILDPYELSVHILKTMYKLYPENLKNRYGIETIDFEDIIPTLDAIAIKRGALLKGGEKDYDKVYSIIIRDLKDNLLGKVTFDRIEELQN